MLFDTVMATRTKGFLDKLKRIYENPKTPGWVKRVLSRETVLYLVFGGLTTVVGVGSYLLLFSAGLSVVPANTLSTLLAVTFAFVVNKQFVFLAKDWRLLPVLKELLAFYGARLVSFLAETLTLFLLVEKLFLPNTPCKVFTQVLVIVLNYAFSKFIFRRKDACP